MTEGSEADDANSQPRPHSSRWRHFPRFRWSILAALGILAALWAAPTIAAFVSYLVASAIDEKPVLSIIMSVVATTALLALLYKPLKSGWGEAASMPSTSQPDS